MSNSESTTTCPTLTGPENFQIWKIRITAKLRQEKVWDTVANAPSTATTAPSATTTTSPGDPAAAPTPTTTVSYIDSWEVRDAKAAGIIVAYVSNRLALEIGELPHAKDMFDKLVSIHVSTNVGVTAFYTFISMLNLKWDGSPSTLSDHIASISAADSKLTAMKKNIDKEFLAFILLHTLPEDTAWEAFRATVLNSLAPGTELSFATLAERLTFTATAQHGASTEAALKANAIPKSKPKPKSDMWCEYHNSTTHNTVDCRSMKEKEDRKGKGKGKAKKKKREKANHVNHDESTSSDNSETSSDRETAGYSKTKATHVSKALMSRILAYVGTANSDKLRNSTIADSGASAHMTPHKNWFKCGSYKELTPPRRIHFGDDSHVEATGIGTVILNCEVNGTTKTVELENTLYVPSFHLTLVSIRKLDKAGYYTVFKKGTCKVKTVKGRKTMLVGTHKDDLYQLNTMPTEHALISVDINTLHRRLGHTSPERLSKW